MNKQTTQQIDPLQKLKDSINNIKRGIQKSSDQLLSNHVRARIDKISSDKNIK